MKAPFDLILFGATGFTGRLVAEYLNTTYRVGQSVSWAIAGRNLDKLARVRELIGADPTLPLIQADATDAASLAGLVAQTRAVISTVGPYQLHGEALVTACARAGTDYVDLCGEPGWMAQMIGKLDAAARASGARIVFSCGFDSIPFDLGVVFLQEEGLRRFGVPLRRVRGRVRLMKGGFSGGTMASAMATYEAIGRDPGLARTL
ncbi:MAG: saccharopine dehydrogenase NADP-binding domain-containing protein, partial [Burkholderiaceae bacterium]|nr:saccharopine dehydrogenase NADP-binding domain-containing protein [Burkholderiaceae bacterium]